MNKQLILLFFSFLVLNAVSQNIQITGITKLYYYKTSDAFFNNKKDSLVGDDIVYDYGKVSFTDKKSNKKIKFHLHKDSSIFAFRIFDPKGKTEPIYAISKGEKRYGVYIGGNKELFCIYYSGGNFYSIKYNAKNYMTEYFLSVNDFGYYLVFTKKGHESKKNGDIEHFIKDKEEIYNKYIKERVDATTYYWNKHFILKQVEYLQLYNN
ncbi:MAG: hypothetical protein H0U95_10370 [Bacteroidetes bacterium]|nr:hypothetical protein [Bacteroidota bacterium]